MTYAYVENSVIQREVSDLPATGVRQDTGQYVLALPTAPVQDQQACGWFVVDNSAVRPEDTATDTYDRTLQLVGDVPTVSWVQRPKTQGEVDREKTETRKASVEDKVQTALTRLDQIIGAADATTVDLTRFNQLQDAVQDIARYQKHIIRYAVIPSVLADDAQSGDLD